MATEFFAFLEAVWRKIELLKNIGAFIFECPYWLLGCTMAIGFFTFLEGVWKKIELPKNIWAFNLQCPYWLLGCTMAIGFFACLEGVWKKIELLKNILAFIVKCPYWLNYHNHLDENVHSLERKMEALRCKKVDVSTQVKTAGSNPRNMTRREVENWLGNVQRKDSDVESIKQNYRATYFLLRAWQGSRIEKTIQELDDLLQQGGFPEGVVLESHQTRAVAFYPPALLDSQNRTLQSIWASVMNDEVLIVGVHGSAGIGKTTITKHIYNRLIESHNFDYVYWVTVLPQWGIAELRDNIAREIRLDLDETDENKGAAKLCQAFEIRKKTALILDDVSIHFPLDKVGIYNKVNGCKVILTTRSLQVCRKMGSRENIKVEPLPLDEAEKLFMEKLGSIDHCAPEIKERAKQIVRECKGWPLTITTMAENLRGVDSIYEWRNALNELREVENGIQDYTDY